MRQTKLDENVFDINALLHPAAVYGHTREVLADGTLTVGEKRAILASWASDAAAVSSCPALRAPAGVLVPISIDEILEALRPLDSGPREPPGGKPARVRSDKRVAA